MLAAFIVIPVLAAATVAAATVLGARWLGVHRGTIAAHVHGTANRVFPPGILRRDYRHVRFLRERLHPGGVFGLELTLGLVVVLVLGGAVGAVLEDVTRGEGITVIDHPVAGFVAARRTADLTSVMHAVSLVGGPVGVAILALIGAAVCSAIRRTWGPLGLVGLGVAGISVIDIVFKAAVGRSRPPLAQAVDSAAGYAFPSGHAASATAVLTVLAFVLTDGSRRMAVRAGVWATAAAGAVAVSVSRVYLGVHWLSDVIGGMLVGALWAVIVITGWRTLRRAAADHDALRKRTVRVPQRG